MTRGVPGGVPGRKGLLGVRQISSCPTSFEDVWPLTLLDYSTNEVECLISGASHVTCVCVCVPYRQGLIEILLD